MDRRFFMNVGGQGKKTPIYVEYITLDSESYFDFSRIDFDTCYVTNESHVSTEKSIENTAQALIDETTICSCQLYKDNELICSLRPCVSTDSHHRLEGALYDEVHEKYYYNSGIGIIDSGSFINELEYITNETTAKINTGIVDDIDNMTYEISIISATGSWYPFQSRNVSDKTQVHGVIGTNAASDIIGLNGVNGKGVISDIIRNNSDILFIKYTHINNNNILYVLNNTTGLEDTKSNSTSYITGESYIYLLGNDYQYQMGTVYYAKLTKNYILVRSFIPAKKNGIACMYDIVTGNYFYSETAAEFVPGPAKQDFTQILTEEELYPLPTCYFIDQRDNIEGVSGLPDEMVVDNYVDGVNVGNYLIHPDGSITPSATAKNATGEERNKNAIAWIRDNSHRYVGKFTDNKWYLRQIQDKASDSNTEIKFANDTDSNEIPNVEEGNLDAIPYMRNTIEDDFRTSGEFYDVLMKFGSDVYYKTEAVIPKGGSAIDENYIRVTICNRIPIWDKQGWNKFDGNTLIGCYEATYKTVNGIYKLYSLSSLANSTSNVSQSTFKTYARNRGDNCKIIDYDTQNILALLFYGYYKHLNCQVCIGSGVSSNDKAAGSRDFKCMEDTKYEVDGGTGNIMFWGLENWWGNKAEWMDDLRLMFRGDNATAQSKNDYLIDYVKAIESDIIITGKDGIDRTYTYEQITDPTNNPSDFFTKYTSATHHFVSIRTIKSTDDNPKIIRFLEAGAADEAQYVKTMRFGTHGDCFYKTLQSSSNNYYADYQRAGYSDTVGHVAYRSSYIAYTFGGVACCALYYSATDAHANFGSRFLFVGNSENINIV